ncbi:efflux RND transporter periplasmic adaptor subunit [Pseudoalteromonas xiamenensis]|uniref:efflux RND transporter periplasmic adaptor subunit n=1 Tax=Pseudoalteromonas xiamenensis TaxID=882626 RepID=UPI0035E6F71D
MKLNKLVSAFAMLGILTLSACSDVSSSEPAPRAAPQVSVAQVINEKISDWDEFTGRLEAPEHVALRPRVSGYISRVTFAEGAMVEEGETLFVIDQAPFKAEVARLEAELVQANSRLQLAKTEFARASKLRQSAAIAEEEVDKRKAQVQQMEGLVKSVQSSLQLALLDLQYTEVKAPISGRVSRALITRGNFVNAGQSLLTTLVSSDRVYAYFDADEQTFLEYMRFAKANSQQEVREVAHPVFMQLAGEDEFTHAGVVDFMDNQIDPTTGTIRARAVFKNQDGSFLPGMFARIKLSGGESYNGVLIEDKAIGTDLNHKFVLVLDESNTVQYRAVELGNKIAGLRVIKSGLTGSEQIVVNGLQRVRPGTPVSPQQVDMGNAYNLQQLNKLQKRLDEHLEDSQMALLTATAGLGLED